MALNIAGMQQTPDIVGNFQRGYGFGQQQRAAEQQRAEQEKLRSLAPQIIAGDSSAYEQAAVISPEAANQYQGVANNQAQKFKNWFTYTDQALQTARKTGNLGAVNAALREGAPFVSKMLGKPAPTEWSPDMDSGWEQLRAKVAMIGQNQQGGTPAQQRHQEWLLSQLPESERPEALKYFAGLGSRPLQESYTWEQVETDQGPRWVQRGRLGTLGVRGIDGAGAPQSGPPGSAAAPVPEGSGGAFVDDSVSLANQMSAAGIPDQQIEAFLNNRLNPQATAQVPPQGGARPLTSAERKYAEESGQQAAQIATLRERGQIEAQNAAAQRRSEKEVDLAFRPAETQAEIDRAGGAEEAKQRAQVRVELEQLLPKVRSESQRTVALIDKALNHPGRAASTGLSSLNPFNVAPGSDAMNFRVLLEQLKGGTFLQAFQSLKGGGAITQVEGTKAEQAIARLNEAQSDEEFIVALQDLRTVAQGLPSSIQEKLIAASSEPRQGGGNIARPTTEAAYNALPSGALFVDPDDGKTYRKP